jgi:hypothetical protein
MPFMVCLRRKIHFFTDYSIFGDSTGEHGPNLRQNSNMDTIDLLQMRSRNMKQRFRWDILFYVSKLCYYLATSGGHA